MTIQNADVLVRAALIGLERAGIEYCLRNGELTELVPGDDVDVLIVARQLDAAKACLRSEGWGLLEAPGHRGHVFMVRLAAEGVWIKLDLMSELRYGSRKEPVGEVIRRRRRENGLWVVAPADEELHRAARAAGHRPIATPWERVRRALPIGMRRRGAVVAVVGPDGAGKGTVIAGMSKALPVATSVVYLGNQKTRAAVRAGNAGGDRSPANPAVARRGLVEQSLRETAFLLHRWVRLQPDFLRAYLRSWSGHLVLCDRHPLDAIAVRPERTRLGRQVEKLLATRLTPSPDAVILLDAPGTVLYDRKGEHSPAILERWRQGYLALPDVRVVDTTSGVEVTTRVVSQKLWWIMAGRRGWSGHDAAA